MDRSQSQAFSLPGYKKRISYSSFHNYLLIMQELLPDTGNKGENCVHSYHCLQHHSRHAFRHKPRPGNPVPETAEGVPGTGV